TPENVDVLAGILHEVYEIQVALNGAKALQIAESPSAPDLILLDVMMPEIDGYEVCRQLQANPNTADIPIIFVTAKNEESDETKGFSLGAVDYITKPISPAIVLARVQTQLALKQARARLEALPSKLARYLSPQVYQSIFEGKTDARIGSSRKKLTVFFSDIVGFTQQTDGMEPEDLAYILNSYLDRMAELVLSHGGTLDKFIGDAVLSFFGDPETRGAQEDALACVEMAMAMQAAIVDLNEAWQAKGIGSEFSVRMGITTGYCTVGNFGSNQRMDYTIIGNQVNLAARLESASSPGEIRISHETWLLVRDHFKCIPQDPIVVKGFERPIHSYLVTSRREESDTHEHIEASKSGFSLSLSPKMIKDEDREAVIEQLKAALRQL
ncbi:MAG: adenylate/guanylate cyclase domain-containing protein, partial [Coraliomargarita sp.]